MPTPHDDVPSWEELIDIRGQQWHDSSAITTHVSGGFSLSSPSLWIVFTLASEQQCEIVGTLLAGRVISMLDMTTYSQKDTLDFYQHMNTIEAMYHGKSVKDALGAI